MNTILSLSTSVVTRVPTFAADTQMSKASFQRALLHLRTKFRV